MHSYHEQSKLLFHDLMQPSGVLLFCTSQSCRDVHAGTLCWRHGEHSSALERPFECLHSRVCKYRHLSSRSYLRFPKSTSEGIPWQKKVGDLG